MPRALEMSEVLGVMPLASNGSRRPGVLEKAHRGTLFLDDVHELSPSLQEQLLRVLDGRVVRPLGPSPDVVDVDLREISATSIDLGWPRFGRTCWSDSATESFPFPSCRAV